MIDEELEQLLKGTKNVNVDKFMDDILNSQEDPGNRIDPESYKESLEAKKSDDDVEEESTEDEFKLKRIEKGKGIEETKDTPSPIHIRSPRSYVAPLSSDKETLQELTVIAQDAPLSSDMEKLKKKFHQLPKHLHSTMEEFLPSMVSYRVNEIAKKTILLYVAEGLLLKKQKTQADVATMIAEVDLFLRNYMSNNILHVHPTQAPVSFAQDLQYQLYQMMKNDEKLHNDKLSIWWSLKIMFEKPAPSAAPCRISTIRLRDHDDHHNDAYPEGENTRDNSTKRKKTSEHGTYTISESSSEQHMDQEPNPSDLDDDEVPTEEVSPELMEEISEEIDEAQPQKFVNDMLRQRCNSGEEHQYHVDQMHNYLKNDIVWKSRKERLSLPTPNKPSPVYHSCQRDPKAPPMTLLNQDLFYLKYGNSRPKKYTLSLHNYLAVSFPDDDT
ncbi:hypothetical protein Tco_1241233 [Tanacetum coccineum]